MTFPAMGQRLQAVLVVVAALAVTAYAAWVVYDFRQTTRVSPARAVTTPQPTEESAKPHASPPEPTRLQALRTAVRKGGDILVIGDSTGDEPGEWVSLWAQDLARHRRVLLQQWDPARQSFTDSAFGRGGRPVRIWNLSYRTAQTDYASHLRDLGAKPEAVLLNIGHDRTPAQLDTVVDAIRRGVRNRWGDVPVALILQNPSTGGAAAAQDTAVRHLRKHATRLQIPVIDVHRAFVAQDDLSSLLVDGSRPNGAGSALWARAVAGALAS